VFDLARLRLTWESRVLSIVRIVVGLLYLQHGLNKFFNFPPTPNHAAYNLFSLNPGLAGIMETVGGVLIILGLFTRPVAFILSGEMAVAYFMVWAPRGFFPFPNGGDATASTVSSSSISSSREAGPGASISCANPGHPDAPIRVPDRQPTVAELTRDPTG
jgi:putative oxidoreductase